MTYTKSLLPHVYRLVPDYIKREYPKYFSLLLAIINYIETQNDTVWFEDSTSTAKELNSIYHNIENFKKHLIFADAPIENKQLVDALFKDYGRTLDFRNAYLSFADDDLRRFLQYSETIFNQKDSWSAYNFIFAIISDYLYSGSSKTVDFNAYYNFDQNFDSDAPPDFYTIVEVDSADISNFSFGQYVKNASGTPTSFGYVKLVDSDENKIGIDRYSETEFSSGESLYSATGALLTPTDTITVISSESLDQTDVILVEFPVYSISIGFDGNTIDRSTTPVKGTRPFEYQMISKSDVFISGDFVKRMKTAVHPAGFRNEVIYFPDDSICEIYVESKIFPKQIVESESLVPDTFDPTTRLTESGNNTALGQIETITLVTREEENSSERASRVKKQLECGMISL